ncbi:MAG: hypothetical protein PF961_04570 [Planctomycetota bacterium]|jgi:hypothetical protein|nr:hypothetical protein [Planctomycetota bacterium]
MIPQDVHNQFAAIVMHKGWGDAETWLREHHGECDVAAIRTRLQAELRFEAKVSLVVLIVSVVAPILVIASYYLFAAGLQAVTGRMAMLLVLVIVGIIALGGFAAWQSMTRCKVMAR